VSATLALRQGVVELLELRGEAELAAIVGRAEVELLRKAEDWRIGLRSVEAQSVGLACDAPDFARLTRDAAWFAEVERAFAEAVRSPTTELASLVLVLRLPAIGRSWASAYRDHTLAEPPAPPPPTSEQLLRASASLARALDDEPAALAFERARLEAELVPSKSGALLRYLLRLEAKDLARAERDVAWASLVERCLRHAATRIDRRVASVELRLRVDG